MNRIPQSRLEAHLGLESSLKTLEALAERCSTASDRVSPTKHCLDRELQNEPNFGGDIRHLIELGLASSSKRRTILSR